MERSDGYRTLLIGWNTDPDLPRGAACRIGSCPELVMDPRQGAEEPKGLDPKLRAQLQEGAERARALGAAEEARVLGLGGRIVTRQDADYPKALFDLALPPPVLSVLGSLPLGEPKVAIVGSRRPSHYGLEVAQWFARELAEAGVSVVSGFAVGIDAAAHWAALESNGASTVAVLGCGLDVDYPRAHRQLRREICSRGALITEFPCGARPEPWRFPVRNRLIAALAQAVIVVEAGPRSGSLVTARLALELGREVFAVPGRLTEELALGPNSLLEEGAHPALSPGRVLESLGLSYSERGRLEPEERPGEDGIRTKLLSLLRERAPLSLEGLASELGASTGTLSSLLLELELEERVRHLPGGLFSLPQKLDFAR
jgi:DNA processing protein